MSRVIYFIWIWWFASSICRNGLHLLFTPRLHKVNSHPLISVVSEKVDVFVSTIWPIVIISLCGISSVLGFMTHLITACMLKHFYPSHSVAVMIYILTGLFSIFYILLISRWIQYFSHAKNIIQFVLIVIFSLIEIHSFQPPWRRSNWYPWYCGYLYLLYRLAFAPDCSSSLCLFLL